MKSPEEMENALRRLVPPALSTKAHSNVSAMIASLAASASTSSAATAEPEQSAPVSHRRYWYAAAAALLIGGMIALNSPKNFEQQEPASVIVSTQSPAAIPETKASPVLLDRLQVTDGMTVEGTLVAADGTMMNQVKRRVETRERYRDPQNGYLITVSETRDEKVLLPKRGF